MANFYRRVCSALLVLSLLVGVLPTQRVQAAPGTATVSGAEESLQADKFAVALTVTAMPEKLTYMEFTEELDVTGGQIKVYWSDGTSQVMDMTREMVTGFDNTRAGTQEITVTYQNKTVSFAVTVNVGETSLFLSGQGTIENPYVIQTKEHLNNVRLYPDSYFQMIEDIVFSDSDFQEGGAFYNNGQGWQPIGTASVPFTGTFDGNGHTITGLQIDIEASDDVDAGLFGYVTNGTVTDLGMVDSKIQAKSTEDYCNIGSVAGCVYSSTISGCYSTGSVSDSADSRGDSYAGGIVGSASDSKLINCYNTGSVTVLYSSDSNSYVGGIAGKVKGNSQIADCYNTGSVLSSSEVIYTYAGGVVGNMEGSGKISNSYNTGPVSSSTAGSYSYVGGVVGRVSNIYVSDCYNTGLISSTSTRVNDYVGGIAGYVEGNSNLTNCYNTGSISCLVSLDNDAYAGGIAGGMSSGHISNSYNMGEITSSSKYNNACAGGVVGMVFEGEISNCYNTGEISSSNKGKSYAGGIAGSVRSGSTIENCYNTGTTFASSTAPLSAFGGGIAGHVYDGTISSCYNIGIVSVSRGQVGGVAGGVNDGSTITSCYYLNRIEMGIGSGDGDTTVCTQEEMKDPQTYVGFDFDTIWVMGDGTFLFPVLRQIGHQEPPGDDTGFSGGSGMPGDPYQITTLEQLDNIRNYLGACFRLEKDLTFAEGDFEQGGTYYNDGQGWQPIGTYDEAFSGNFDGNGHTITGLKISIETSGTVYAGLFGYIKNGTVTNLGVVDSDIQINGTQCYGYLGGISGYVFDSTITDCYNTGVVSASASSNYTTRVGGIAGVACNDSTVSNCYNTGAISASSGTHAYAGGIVGDVESGIIRKSNNTGIVSSSYSSGGIVGNMQSGSVEESYNVGEVSSNSAAGGVAGNMSSSTISNSHNSGLVQGSHKAGGVVGAMGIKSEISESYNTGEVASSYYGGGITGYAEGQCDINNSHNTGFVNVVSVDAHAGGIVGYMYGGAISQCYNLAQVAAVANGTAAAKAGGIGGIVKGSISNSYNSGNVFSSNGAGGIVGYLNGSEVISSCYNTGSILATNVGGGIAGNVEDGTIKDCYNIGSVWGNGKSGGVAGNLGNGTIISCYNTGWILGKSAGGGIAGGLDEATISGCYNIGSVFGFSQGGIAGEAANPLSSYKISNCCYLNRIKKGVGFSTWYGYEDAISCSLEEMKDFQTFVGFDFESVWTMGAENYPLPVHRQVIHQELPDNYTDFSGGNGSLFNPYRITTCEQLNNVRNYLGASFVLDESLSFSEEDFAESGAYYNEGQGWQPIGTNGTPFFGIFEGNGHTITGLKTNIEASGVVYSGFFGNIANSTITNLGVVNSQIQGSGRPAYVGTVAGKAQDSTIRNCYSTGQVNGYAPEFLYAGGIVGGQQGCSIKGCYNTGTVCATDKAFPSYIGGIVGKDDDGEISECYNTGVIIATADDAGGIVGVASDTTDIYNCYNIGNVACFSEIEAGDIAGAAYGANIRNCYYLDVNPEHTESGIDGITACTLTEMKDIWTFAGFDFESVWDMGNGDYPLPVLRQAPHREPVENYTDFSGGNGSLFNPYRITTIQQLNRIRDYLGGCFQLENDLVFTEEDFSENGAFYNNGQGWQPIGAYYQFFFGSFDGNGHTITGLKIDASDLELAGLFGRVKSGTVTNLGMKNAEIEATSDCVGVIAGTVKDSVISCCYSTGGVALRSEENAPDGSIGGIAGEIYSSIVVNSYNVSTISNSVRTNLVGGIAGYAYESSVSLCYNVGDVISNLGFVGGIAGKIENTTVSKCYFLDQTERGVGYGDADTIACTRAEMTRKETFRGFDFETVWTMEGNPEYPFPELLKVESGEDNNPKTETVFRVYNPANGKHHYTTDAFERDFLAANGWIYEGIAWYAPKEGSPIYRVYNPGNDNHLYTMDAAERDRLVKGGWKYEGILCYSADETGTPLYRVFNPYVTQNPHHYTDSLEECAFLESNGWRIEGISWYGLSK